MGLALILFLGGAIIFAWFYLWSRQRESLGDAPGIADMLDHIPSASSDDALLVSREHGQLVYINDRARTWLNMNGETPNLEYAARMANPSDSFLSLFGGEVQSSFQVGERWVEASSHRIPNGTEMRTVVVMRELGAATHNPDALDLAHAMKVINCIGEIVNASMSVEQVLQTLLSVVQTSIHADAGEICLWNEAKKQLEPRGWIGDYAYVLDLQEAGGYYEMGEGITGWIARYGKPVLVTDVEDRAAILPKLNNGLYQSYVGVPLMLGERLMGTFEFASTQKGFFSQKDMALLQAVSTQMTISIHNAELYAVQVQHIDDMASLQQVVQQKTSDQDEHYVRAVYEALTERLANLSGAEMCGILLFNDATETLVPELPFYGLPDQIVLSYSLPLPKGSEQREVWEKHQYWMTNDVIDDPMVEALELVQLADLTGVQNTALIPLVMGDRRFGALQVSNKRSEGGFSVRDMQDLRILAAQAAIVVENTRLYQREKSRETELIGLQEITHAIGSFNQEDEFYSEITARIANLMNIMMCGVLLYDESQEALVARLPFFGVENDLLQHYVIPIEPQTPLYEIWTEQDYWYTNNVSTDRLAIVSGLEVLALAVGVTKTMLAILTVGGRRLGVVQVSNKNNGEDFTEQDARLLMIFAAQAAALIENARLYREMQQRADEAVLLRDEAQGLRRIAELCGGILTADEPFTPVLAEIARLLDSPIVFINLLGDYSANLITHPRYTYGVELGQPIVQDSYASGYDKSVAISQQPFISNDLAADKSVLEGYRHIAEQIGLNSVVMVPLVVGERSLGEVGVANRSRVPYDETDRQLLNALAIQIAATLDRIMLYQSADTNLNRRIQELDAIARVSNELTLTLDLDRVLEIIRQEAARATSAMGTTIALLKPRVDWADENTPELLRRIGSNRQLETLADIERAATLNPSQSLIVEDYSMHDALQPLPLQASSAVAVAFLFSDEAVGVLHVYHEEPNAFDERAASFMLMLSSKAALGYGNAVRFDEQMVRSRQLQRRVEQLNQIFELGHMLQTGTDPVTMLEAIAYSVQQSVGFDVVLMLLLDEEAGLLRRVAQAGLPLDIFEQSKDNVLPRQRLDLLLHEENRVSESYLLKVEDGDSPHHNQDWQALDTHYESERDALGETPQDWHEGDQLLVPIQSSGGEMLGMMVLDGPQDNLRPTRDRIEVLEIFSHQAAATIENTRLYLESLNSAEQEAQINAVMEAVSRSLDVSKILLAVAQGALRLMPFGQMHTALWNRENENFDVVLITVKVDSSLAVTRDTWTGLQNTAMGRSFDDGQSYIYHADTPEIETYADLSDWYHATERTSMIVPLITGGTTLGVMHLGSELIEAFGFSEFMPLIQRMASLTAVAIQNANLFNDAVNLQSFTGSSVESIQQGIVVLDRSLRVMSINNFMRKRYGWTDEAIGEDLFVYRPQLMPILMKHVNHTMQNGEPQERSGQHHTALEKRRTSNFYTYPLGGDASNVRGVVLMVEDITERSRLEQDLQARANQLAALTEVSSRITASLDYNEVVALALSEMERVIAYDTMTFWTREGDLLLLQGAQDYQDDTIPTKVRIRISSHERLSRVVETQRVYSISDLQGWDKLPGEDEAVSWMGVPLVNQGDVVGVISVTKNELGFYNAQAEQAAFAFANQVTVALANAELFREAERRTQRLSLLNRVSVSLGQSLDSEDILEIALREISQVLNVDYARALLIERDVHVGRVVVEHPRGDTPPDETVQLRESSLYQYIRRTVQSIIIPNVNELEDVPEEFRLELLPRGMQSYILIPMAIGGQVIGAFEMQVLGDPVRFLPEQTDLARIIANQAAIAIQNTNLLEQTLARSRELETLLEASQATSMTRDLQEVFQSVVELMMHSLDMDDCSLMLWDDVDNVLQVQAAVNRNANPDRMTPAGTQISLKNYPARLRTLREREVTVINEESADEFPREFAEMTELGDAAQMLVPLVVRDQAIGLIQLELESHFRSFSYSEIRLAQALGSQAATAIENARLSTETSNRVEELYIINDLSQTISATINIDEMIRVVRDRVPDVVDVEEMYLALYHPEDQRITFPLALREGKEITMEDRVLNTDEVSYVIRNRRPLSIGSDYFSTDELRRSLGITAGEGEVRSYLGVPLIAGDQVVGVMAVRDSKRTRAFGVNSQGILTTIASQLGAAIQNARFFDQLNSLNKNLEASVASRTEELQQERDRIDTLYRIASELARTLDLGRVLNRALDMVANAVGAEDGVIMQIDPTSDSLNVRAQLRRVIEDNEIVSHPAQTLANWLIENPSDHYVLEADLLKTEYWDASASDGQVWHSAIAVLLEINDDIHGVMVLLSTVEGAFTQEHVRLVNAAANQVAAAINNSDLYYIIRDQAERLGMLLLAQQEETEKSEAILEGIADGVMLADASGRIIRFNSAAERILAVRKEQVMGHPLSRLGGLRGTSGKSWMQVIEGWQQAASHYSPDEFISERLDLKNKVVNVRLSPVYIGAQFLGVVLVLRDITREVEADRAKSAFVASVSHELKTPLTPIKGYTDLLLLRAAGEINEHQENFLKTIKSHADRLDVLVNDLLNISELDEESELNAENIDQVELGPLLKASITSMESRLEHESKGITVSLNVEPKLPSVAGDPTKLSQIFTNIIDNAFNYTYAGGSIDIEAHAQDADHVLVSIKDTGIGIPVEFREKVWDRFERNEEHALVMEVAGTGLGLPIVRTLVEMHHGKVWFETEEGQGTTFFVLLPIEQLNHNPANN